jgi:class 3 adenylate cyclase/tetratricopeptide (TPR) repeat protein
MGVGSEFVQLCPACGKENPEGFLHCGFCTAALTAPAAERRKLATLVFCDVSGSTAMGERLDPEAVRGLMRAYFVDVRAVLERHGGTVEKFIGDAVVAAFGIPHVHEDDALRACRAALEIQSIASEVKLRIGVNTGEVVSGDPSARESFMTGDAVNVAARLEQAAPVGGVLIGESTYRLVRHAVTVEAIEPLVAKGKSEPLTAYRLVTVTGSIARHSSPLVGRGPELELLEREFDSSLAENRCRLVTVIGEAGVGKSRLAAEFVRRVGPRARVVRGACLSYGEGITFWAIAQIVRELAGIREEHSVEEARERVEPRIAQLLGLSEGSATADQMMQAIASFLSAAAAERPLIVLVDDIHWAEPALFDLLDALPRMVGGVPLLLCCMARPELLEARPEWPVTVRLEPLGAAEVDALLEELGAPAAMRVRIARASAGNPLFAEELVAWLRENDADADALPTSLNALLGARLDRLEADARDALERGAVEGELFHRGAVMELSEEKARSSVPDGLEELTGKDMIRPAAASFAGDIAFRFKHILVRDAAYRATAKKLRASLHEHFADWLERLAGDRVGEYEEILGYHFEQAYRYREELGQDDDDPPRALAAGAARHLGVAGRRANDRGDVRAAANLLSRATALLPADSLERLELLIPYAYAVGESGRGVEARALWAELYESATAFGERGLAAHARGKIVSTRQWDDPNVDIGESRAIFEELIATFAELGDESGLAKTKRYMGMSYRFPGRQAEAAEWLERALVHANACGDMVTRRIVTQSLTMILPNGPMPVGDAIRRCEELRDANRDDRVLEAVINRCLAELLAMAGRFDEAREFERSSSRVLEETNMNTPSRVSQTHVAYTKELVGDRAGAERELEERWLYFRRTLDGAPDEHGRQAAYRLVHLYCDEGRWDEAEECHAFYRDVPDRVGMLTVADRLAGAARIAAHNGEVDEALTLAKRAVEIVERTDNLNESARSWEALAEVERAAGRTAEADAAVAKALELYEQKGNVAAATALQATAKA